MEKTLRIRIECETNLTAVWKILFIYFPYHSLQWWRDLVTMTNHELSVFEVVPWVDPAGINNLTERHSSPPCKSKKQLSGFSNHWEYLKVKTSAWLLVNMPERKFITNVDSDFLQYKVSDSLASNPYNPIVIGTIIYAEKISIRTYTVWPTKSET